MAFVAILTLVKIGSNSKTGSGYNSISVVIYKAMTPEIKIM
jgi:hypothetical protein